MVYLNSKASNRTRHQYPWKKNKDEIALYCASLHDRFEVVQLLLDCSSLKFFGYGGKNSITSGMLAAFP